MLFESSLSSLDTKGRMPFVRLIIPLIAGIIAQFYLDFSVYTFWLLPLIALLSLGYRWLPPVRKYAWRHWLHVLVHVQLFFVGAILLYCHDERYHPLFYQGSYVSGDAILLRLEGPPVEKNRSICMTATIQGLSHQGQWKPARGKLLVYVERQLKDSLRWGDDILVKATPSPIRNGPGGFDYRQYCAMQGIYGQLFLRRGDSQLFQRNGPSWLEYGLYKGLHCCTEEFQQYIGDPEAGMASALLVGFRQGLDKEIVQDYSNTGIIHVIAISGMHLALLYSSLLLLLSWLPARRGANWIKAAVVLFFLWSFTLLTGASASVLRAAVMFSGTTIGRFILARQSNIFNTLAASAFLLLCYNPYLVMDVGFQLSYLAVLSILLFYQAIYTGIKCPNKWLDHLWQMVALTLAAQILTTPICLYLFHQFPTWFLPANLLAVPLSTVVIYLSILLLAVSWSSWAAHYIGMLVKWLIIAMDASVRFIGLWPGALIRGITCSIPATLLLYAAIACWVLYQQQFRSAREWAIFCCCGAVVAGILAVSLKPPPEEYRYKNYILHQGKKIVVIDSALGTGIPAKKFQADYILLTRNPHTDIRRILDFYRFDTLIIGAGNSPRRIEQWKSECDVLTLRFISVPDQGAYVINF
ncbi:MAG: ComEC family competence protein [Chitinophaga sp.]|uniref:ComEC/Rec2 family competence protein n=1 Tax=Chitinophaga sp. TaxID=1869181 RepID=UPI0025B90E4C|nr:ComEC/Rec2 family competence protein [Chitinophaga sp.]MBV8254487.1 ComEC family competence protein [Chitinophaga sp.]